jgi:hypothetical protein
MTTRAWLVVALFACDSDATPTPTPPKPFTRAQLDTMMSTQLDTYTADLVPGHIENRANRRYTKRSPDGVEQSIVVTAGTCAPSCLSMHGPTFQRTVDPVELVPEADRVDPTTIELEKRKLPDGRHGVAVFTRSKSGSGGAFARYTVYYNNGVNDLRVRATATFAGRPETTELMLDVLKGTLERDTQDALVSFIRYY